MAARAKERLERLIQDLEGGGWSDDGSYGDQPGAERHEKRRSAVAAPSPKRRERLSDDAASSASLGLSELAAESTENDVPAARDGAAQPARGWGAHQADLEHKVMALLQERRALEARHARDLAERDAEAARLRAAVDGELAALSERQGEVEARAPLVARQLAEARAALLEGDLVVSREAADALRALPSERLGLADAVRLALHDGMQSLAGENERLRLAGDAAREAVARLDAECGRLRRDNARLAAATSERQADVESTIAALEGRCARLGSELEEAAVAVEVLRAKGRAYDEVEARAERMEAEVARLRPFEASAAQLVERLREAEEGARAAEAREAVAATERGFLARELQDLRDRAARAESDLVARDDKISDLKRARAELHQRLHDADAAARGKGDERLERELARLQAQAAADMDAIRQEAADGAEREVRLMREMRDAALDDAASSKADLRELALAHDALEASAREARLAGDVRVAELLGEGRLRAFEMQRAQAQCEERGAALQEARQRLELLEDKVRTLTGSTLALEADRDRSTAELRAQLDAAVGQLAQYEAAEMGLAGAAALPPGTLGGWGGAAGAAPASGGEQADGEGAAGDGGGGGVARRPLRALGLQALSARCAQLEAEKGELRRSWREAEGRLARAEADLAGVRARLAAVGQPQAFVLERLAEAQARAEDADARAAALQDALEEREAAHRAALEERGALRGDLARLLRERGALDSLRSLVAGALGRAAARTGDRGGDERGCARTPEMGYPTL
ncbi:MAG: hypothetical protein J3K34DRAFT_527091 [Monoraphidium minutum]|nr:MAG: hypothetical protein J3K34DRAFT_527091 [Monoraphidium minutum]